MLPTFCLRLALGMIAPLCILPAAIVPPRFFRVQFLATVGLLASAGLFLSERTDVAFWSVYGLAMTFTLAGSIVWHTDEAPLGRTLFFLATISLIAMLTLYRATWLLVDDLAAAGVLGGATAAMLMGHSYLIAPTMSLSPLNRLLGHLTAALAVRAGLACLGLWWWTRLSAESTLERETVLWLAARWLLGLLIPIGLTWMAWETARIRSTQSATGILYVIVVVCYLGELVSLLLVEKTGWML